MSAPLECQDAHRGDCRGPVEMRLRPSDWKSFPRCDHHAEAWYAEQERIQRAYGGATAPSDFDPAYAGERWDEDY
jgi:hypothetical protein